MYTLLTFLKTIQVVLIFIILEIIGGYIFFKSNPYQQAVAINATNQVMGGIYSKTASVESYFSLGATNRQLADENAKLRQQLSELRQSDTTTVAPTKIADTYIAARVINNSISGQNNYITIDKGTAHGIKTDMALVNNDGIIGYVVASSKNFSVGISILNRRDFVTSGRLNKTDLGKITWNGRDYQIVQLTEIPKYAQISIGDTITTTQYSNIFPDNYPIGTVRDFKLYNGTSFNVNVKLFADMSKLDYVYAVTNEQQPERAKLEEENIEE